MCTDKFEVGNYCLRECWSRERLLKYDNCKHCNINNTIVSFSNNLQLGISKLISHFSHSFVMCRSLKQMKMIQLLLQLPLLQKGSLRRMLNGLVVARMWRLLSYHQLSLQNIPRSNQITNQRIPNLDQHLSFLVPDT